MMEMFKPVFLYSGYGICRSSVTPSGYIQNALVDVSGCGTIYKTEDEAEAAIRRYLNRSRKGLKW